MLRFIWPRVRVQSERRYLRSCSLESITANNLFAQIDDFNREILAIEIDTSLPALRVVRVLEQTIKWRGKPKRIRVDNGPEFISTTLALWCEENRIILQCIQPGKPTQNAYIERFNGSFRKDILDAYLFENLHQVRMMAEDWMDDYNDHRPHDSLSGRIHSNYYDNEMIKV